MPKAVRVVLDTNVVISGMFWEGIPREILGRCEKGELKAVFSRELLEELRRVIARERKFNLKEEEIREKERALLKVGEMVEPKVRVNVVTDDPDDNKLLECALASGTKVIISRDKDLLRLGSWRGIMILTPETFSREFLFL